MPNPAPNTMHHSDPDGWARALGISRDAIDVYLGSDVIDLHIETFNWQRMINYDMRKKHGKGPLGARLFGQVDVQRIRDAAVTGGTWSISTNPLRPSKNRADTLVKNIARMRKIFASVSNDVSVVKNLAEYQAAKSAGRHAAFMGIQGGNALDASEDAIDRIPDDVIIRITLVHLSTSKLGSTSAPSWLKKRGLTPFGQEYVRRMNQKKILVDLAHINREGFFDAVAVHDKSQPLIVTHTGISAVLPHWRNIDDAQIKAIADTGGTIGIIYQWPFLGKEAKASNIVDHMEHIIKVAGDDYVSLGSDWDGAILPPRDMQTCLDLPKLVQIMLDRGWKPERISKILGGNFLRVVGHLRGAA